MVGTDEVPGLPHSLPFAICDGQVTWETGTWLGIGMVGCNPVHLLIVEMIRNRFLRQTLGFLEEMDVGMETTSATPCRLARSSEDHRLLCEAVRDQDPEAVRAVSHIVGARGAAVGCIRVQVALAGAERAESTDMAADGDGASPLTGTV